MRFFLQNPCSKLLRSLCDSIRNHQSIFQEEELKGAILVVLANKQDIEGAMSVTEVHKALGLEALKNRTFQIFKASAIKGDGLDESMEWLSKAIQNRK